MYTPKIQRSRYAQNLQQVSSQLQIPDSIQAMNDQMTIYVARISSTWGQAPSPDTSTRTTGKNPRPY